MAAIRILFLNYEYPPLGGGASPISAEIAEGYVARGHEVEVVTMGFKDLPEFEEVNGVRINRISGIRGKKEICHPHEMLHFLVHARSFLKKLLANRSFDVCHTHFAIPTGVLAQWVKKRYRIPYIITSHGSDIPGYNADRFRFLHLFTKPLLGKVLKNSSGNFTGSNYLAGLANDNLKPPIAYQTIREGFYANLFEPKEKTKTILSTGRLLRRKGFQHLIAAVKELDAGYHLHICGDGPMMAELKELAIGSKTPVVFHGWIDNSGSTYKQLLESAAIYALVSERENASKSLLEAMSAGCALISSRSGGCPETIGKAGITVDAGDVLAIRAAILALVSDEEGRKRAGKHARERILTHYDWERLIPQYLAVLERVKITD